MEPAVKTVQKSAAQTSPTQSYISGAGMYVPDKVVPNSYFESYLDTSDEWIRERTGIRERRWTEFGTGASVLAEPAARKAIAAAGLSVADIDGIVVATVTPDCTFPSTACFLQSRLGMTRGFAFDLNAVCSGFIYALVTADALIAAGRAKHLLVVGVDIFSHLVDRNDRSTCVLFGDGAGAVVLSSTKLLPAAAGAGLNGTRAAGSSHVEARGIIATEIHSDGSQSEILCVANGSAKPLTPERIAAGDHLVKMAGREVFKQAVRALAAVSESVLNSAGVTVADLDYYVSHQANKRILLAVGKQLEIPEEKVLINVDKYGNTSAASLPILIAESAENGTLKKGDLIMLSAFGGGVTWGAILLRW